MKLLRMAQYPREIRIPRKDKQTETYSIRWVSRRSREMPSDVWAHCDQSKSEIVIRRGLGRKDTFKSFIHELLHAIEFEYPINLKHKDIYALEDAIFELLQLNT